MNTDDMNRIAPLSEMDDFKVADGDPDIRGWTVTTEQGRSVGEVDELLVDTQAMKVRYLVVDLDEGEVGADHRVLVPIGAARLDDDDDRVIVSGIAPEQFATLPEYQPGAFDREYESSVLSGYQGTGDTNVGGDMTRAERERQSPSVSESDAGSAGSAAGSSAGSSAASSAASSADYYAGRHFDDSNFYGPGRGTREARVTRSEEELAIGKRAVQAGEVEVRKTIETEHVREPVTRMREEVTIERHPVDAQTTGNVEIGEDEIRIPVVEEELIVEKRPVVKEEIVVKKRAITEERTVEADVRRERIDIDDSTAHSDRGVRDELRGGRDEGRIDGQ